MNIKKLDRDHLEAERRRSEATDILDEIIADDLDKLRSVGWDNAADFVADMQERREKYGENLYVSQAQLDWLYNIKEKLEE